MQQQCMPAHVELENRASPFCKTDLIACTLCFCIVRLRHRTETVSENGDDHCIFDMSIHALGTQQRKDRQHCVFCSSSFAMLQEGVCSCHMYKGCRYSPAQVSAGSFTLQEPLAYVKCSKLLCATLQLLTGLNATGQSCTHTCESMLSLK